MIIAEKKRKENIIEYILYMWQIEDMLRACNLEYDEVVQKIISGYDQPPEVMMEIAGWYQSHLEMMKAEGKQSSGHLAYLETLVEELQDLHNRLLNITKDQEYQALYKEARKAIQDLEARITSPLTEVEICLNGLYGFLMLKLQNKTISDETREAVDKISGMLRYLAEKFKAGESGLEEF